MIESEDDGLLKHLYLNKLIDLEENYYLKVTILKMKYIYLHKTVFKNIS